ncbi:hypothetical protein EK21DRAFT_109828 [Setomelanomma holmii]|uniref:F-box domain-containing protein n=1 Tax=Setomelanomma holmii TaxID=210430 RepID=A0A9P4HDX1_9PLEO|nr:hypothetical protein EK21DRAFT_109828 [Setomelanomma holmii]
MSHPMTHQTSRLQVLPPELIAQIARNVDDTTLIAFAATTRGIRTKSYHIYGDRLFCTVKFCIYPNTVQALVDISYTPHLVQFIRHVGFGTEDVGLLDPLHDGHYRQGRTPHRSASRIQADEYEQLLVERTKCDIGTIALALKKLPNLEVIIVGHQFLLDVQCIRSSWGASDLHAFECPSGHCFGTIVAKPLPVVYWTFEEAIQRMETNSRNVQLGVSLDQKDLNMLTERSDFYLWNESEYGSDHVTSLRLVLGPRDDDLTSIKVKHLVESALYGSCESAM